MLNDKVHILFSNACQVTIEKLVDFITVKMPQTGCPASLS
jgi:hypothetical protein